MSEQPSGAEPSKRSSFAAKERRIRQRWEEGRDFRVLSLDGGGIRGTFTAAFLDELEARSGAQVADLFDLVVGTSTGGIIAIGLAAGIPAADLLRFYVQNGKKIFPRPPAPFRWMLKPVGCVLAKYDSLQLKKSLVEALGPDISLGDIVRTRLCIQAFDALHGEVFIFKTPHHPDYHLDKDKRLVDVALATSAAPTYFLPQISEEGYVLADGGVWANNPVMVGIVEAFSTFDVPMERIKVVSIGCGDSYQPVGFLQRQLGGLLPWAKVVHTAIHLQSLSAIGQAKHLVGPENLVRIDVPDEAIASISLDDAERAVRLMPPLGKEVAAAQWPVIAGLLGAR